VRGHRAQEVERVRGHRSQELERVRGHRAQEVGVGAGPSVPGGGAGAGPSVPRGGVGAGLSVVVGIEEAGGVSSPVSAERNSSAPIATSMTATPEIKSRRPDRCRWTEWSMPGSFSLAV
jgi:hypothetical protein